MAESEMSNREEEDETEHPEENAESVDEEGETPNQKDDETKHPEENATSIGRY